ncbi:MAG: SseB family protein [Candidatus Dadabacteria bacterium]|nr:MAG: SseB family protein [Candidatus Dadabacteria bacterium]
MSDDRNVLIEQSMQSALEGEPVAVRCVLQGFLDGPLYVPERYQYAPMSDSPNYPNDFVTVLGVQNGERVIVPVFTASELIKEWCGNDLKYKKITGEKLITMLPEGWWVCINPGSEVEKELSPWEISKLGEGPGSIDEIVEDITDAIETVGLEIRIPDSEEYSEIKAALVSKVLSMSQITALSLLEEIGLDENGNELKRPVVGVQLRTEAFKERENLHDELEATVASFRIGQEAVKFVYGSSKEDISLSIFNCVKPFYQNKRENHWWGVLKNFFNRR